jgi:hypothetical protein
MTEWRACFHGFYEVSRCGLLRRAAPGQSTRVGRIVRGWTDSDGYQQVDLSAAPRRKTVMLHRVVAGAWIGPRPDGLEVNHRDGDKQNNAASNLEYVTHAANMQHYKRTIKTHCKHGHRFTATNTYVAPGGGGRHCRACGRRRAMRYSHKRKATA